MTRSSAILEIGAGYNPVAPKADGWNTHVVDHADQATLRRKYADANVDVSRIEDVDTIWRGGPLDQAIPDALLGRFDAMIASHVLEHMPDLIGFLKSAERLMTPDGVMSLALPDRRFCFDCLKPATTAGDVLEAHANRRSRHGMRTIWNHMAYSASVDGRLAWDGSAAGGAPRFLERLERARSAVSASQDEPDGPYEDLHCWYFTPTGFALVMLELAQIGAIDWTVESLTGTEGFEFFALLRRGVRRIVDPESIHQERMRLIREHMLEQRVVIDSLYGDRTEALMTRLEARFEPLSARLDRLIQITEDQERRLREIEITAAMTRRALSPLRLVWRGLRRLTGR